MRRALPGILKAVEFRAFHCLFLRVITSIDLDWPGERILGFYLVTGFDISAVARRHCIEMDESCLTSDRSVVRTKKKLMLRKCPESN